MADPRQIEQELREYLMVESNLRREDRIKYLMTIIDKHFSLDSIEHVVTYKDLTDMMSNAKAMFADTKLPIRISQREVDSRELPHVLMIESFVGYLNRNKLIKRLVKFDYKR
jgi:hypothetical protein